jgi:hypothetical protein
LLDYIALYTNTSLDKYLKVLLIDWYNSYINPDFTIKAIFYNIYLYLFSEYFIYILQLLDISIFQLYKYWYKKAVQYTIYNFDLDYNIVSFIHDLYKIWAEIFKKGTIYSIFRKTGI